MRLIDADALKQAILSIMPERSEVLLIVDNQPEGIVRCKDCNKRGTSECYVENASGELAFPWIPQDDWFCADAERKDGETDG